MTSLPALREAVAKTYPYCGLTESVPDAIRRYEAAKLEILNALPALLDEVEAARDENKRLRKYSSWPRCQDCGAEMVEVHPEQDKECVLCVTKGKLEAERIENTHLREACRVMEKAANGREVERDSADKMCIALRADLAALKTAPCPCCGAMAEDYVKGRCLDVDNDPGVFTSGEPHD